MDDNRKKLYDALSGEYDMGTYDQFCKDIQDSGKRKRLYDATSKEYDYGTYDSFSRQLGFDESTTASHSQTPAQKPLISLGETCHEEVAVLSIPTTPLLSMDAFPTQNTSLCLPNSIR